MMANDSRLDPTVDRRSSKRFPIEQEVQYRTLDHKAPAPENGIGKTLDISSGGVLFETAQRLRFGKRVEVSINWPAKLDGNCLLKFVAVGRVIRVEDARAAIRIEQYEFRTRRAKQVPGVSADTRPSVILPFQ